MTELEILRGTCASLCSVIRLISLLHDEIKVAVDPRHKVFLEAELDSTLTRAMAAIDA
jgi:hypothetical protein